MRLLKSHPILRLGNSYLVDSPQPVNLSYLWNFGSLLAICLIIQIITGVTLAMHYNPSVAEAFNSVEHIMRDVNNGWLIRYLHSNTASAFFFLVYLHIGRGMYYGSYRAPRTLVWTIGTVIFILMMAKDKWPNWMLISHNKCIQDNLSYFSKSRTKALYRIGPHNKDVLSIIICGMLGDWWADKIKGQISTSVRFSIEQGINNTAYIHNLTLYFNKLGYCSNITPHLVKKSDKDSEKELEDRFNYRLTLYTFTSLWWIYHSFYKDVNGKKIKAIPSWIGEYITPIGLAHIVMQIGCLKPEGLILCTKFNDTNDLNLLKTVLMDKYRINTTILSYNEKMEICIKVESIPLLRSIINPHIYPELSYILDINHLNTVGNYENSNDNIKIAATYNNADLDKELAVKENKGKAGIYRWINKETGKSYVGSSASRVWATQALAHNSTKFRGSPMLKILNLRWKARRIQCG